MIMTFQSCINCEDLKSHQYDDTEIRCLQHTAEDDLSDFFAPAVRLLAVQILENI